MNISCLKVLIRLVLASVLVWILLFNVYALFYKLESIFNAPKSKKTSGGDRHDLNSVNNGGKQSASENTESDRAYNYAKRNEFELAKIIDSTSLEFFKRIQRKDYQVNCQALIEWNEEEHRKAKRILFKLRNSFARERESATSKPIPMLPDSNFVFDKSMCELYKELRGYQQYKGRPLI